MAGHETPIPADIRDEANRLAEAAISLGLSARLIGGLAIWLRCPSVRSGPFARSYEDMDFAITSASSTKFKALLMTQGYIPDQFFNGLHGATRLYYSEPTGRWSIDVVIDELAMSHTLDLRGRLDGPAPTITLADLLLTKLQVWEINRKDLGDALCLLADHALSDDDSDTEGISLPRVRSVLGKDWGFCHTVLRNTQKVAALWSQEPLHGAARDVAAQVAALQQAIEDAPKSRAWRLRSRLGERVRWYETPEEVKH
ncbi:MAG TPA: hypothetical protein VG299_03700 [Candidatus Dormibacteraeota bacterium]|jgi:hypothetical protein|nr:hypothetical protein [Candidatus Dormibacteraeota bacterium]